MKESKPYGYVKDRPGVADHVEHVDAAGKSCGPLVLGSSMPRPEAYASGAVACAACGNAVEVPPTVARDVGRADRAYERERAREPELARLAAAGVDVSKLPERRRRAPRPKPEQGELRFGGAEESADPAGFPHAR